MTNSYRMAHELDRVLRQIDARMKRRMAEVDAHDIGHMGCLALMHLDDAQPCSIQDLAERMGRDTSQMARIVKHLEVKETVSRHAKAEDRRVVLLRITEPGGLFVDLMKGVLSDVVEEVSAPLTQKERERLMALLGRI